MERKRICRSRLLQQYVLFFFIFFFSFIHIRTWFNSPFLLFFGLNLSFLFFFLLFFLVFVFVCYTVALHIRLNLKKYKSFPPLWLRISGERGTYTCTYIVTSTVHSYDTGRSFDLSVLVEDEAAMGYWYYCILKIISIFFYFYLFSSVTDFLLLTGETGSICRGGGALREDWDLGEAGRGWGWLGK